MLYLGFFNVVEEPEVGSMPYKEQEAYFTLLVEAEDPDQAVSKFWKLIWKHKNKGDLFCFAKKVFFQTMLEVKEIPKQGLLVNYMSGFPTLNVTLHMPVKSSSRHCNELIPIVGEDAPTGNPEDERTLEPFVDFTQAQSR